MVYRVSCLKQESAVLEGKIRPQFDRLDGRPDKVPVSTRADVKLREKQRDFEKLDYQAQKVRFMNKDLYRNLKPTLSACLPEKRKFCLK